MLVEEKKPDVPGDEIPGSNETNETGTSSNTDYISALKEMKKNSVPRDEYEAVKEENKKLLAAIVNGEELPNTPKEEEVNADEIRKKLFSGELNNLDYVKNALALREKLIKEGKEDPFLPFGKGVIPTDNDVAAANRVAQVFQECLDYADGDSDVFTTELQRRTRDIRK